MTVAEIQAEKDFGKVLDQYAGQWVAVDGHDVVAHAATLQDLLGQIEEKQVETVFQVVEDGNSACFY